MPCRNPEDPECWSSAEAEGEEWEDEDGIPYKSFWINVDIPFTVDDVDNIIKSWMKEELCYTDDESYESYGSEVMLKEVFYHQQRILVSTRSYLCK